MLHLEIDTSPWDATRTYDSRTERLRLADLAKGFTKLPNVEGAANSRVFSARNYIDACKLAVYISMNGGFKRDKRKGAVPGPNCELRERNRCEVNCSLKVFRICRSR
jgi:hypothetical protein